MLKKALSCLMVIMVAFLVGCAANTHIIGDGAKGSDVVSKRQWYALWGLAPLNKVDSKDMAGSATSYEINTQQSFVDVLITSILGGGLLYTRTVTVKK
jgi:hypothetical protein